MIEWPLLILAGLVGSSHCLGMCGPFVLAIGAASRGASHNLWRQLAYSGGRLFTYAVLGACAGLGGAQLTKLLPGYMNIPALLAIIAGLYLIYQGLLAAGVIRPRVSATHTCGAASLFRTLLTTSSSKDAFLAGLFTGLLPCGLLYGMLALAGSTHHPLYGSLSMAVFGLGTLPAMLLAGSAGRLLSLATRRQVFAVAAWCMVLTGVVSIVRGATHVELFGQPAVGCPMCIPPEHQSGR
ncbi:MAG TPA: sulfite exporter TauE/SafE family protein [Pirellulaceae bacterium]|nr:sulfite exporter TauE/SafE family protein [Pirellulaceae bacterium]